jgi:methionyl-tRNA formyltransferase
MTPRRPQSEMLIRRLVQSGITPSLVLYHRKQESTSFKGYQKSIKDFLKSILFFRTMSERVRRVRLSNERDADRFLDIFARKYSLYRDEQVLPSVREITQINHEETAKLLRSHEIDVLFIWGVPIIRPIVIDSVRSMVLNAHSSILPEYRGARSEFWQCYHQDFAHAGVTLHKVDVGVDTGDILLQVRAESADLIHPERLKVSNAIRVIESLPGLLASIKSGTHQPLSQADLPESRTPTYRIRDVRLHHLSKVYLGLDFDDGR